MLELICGACHGRLLVETPGTTVACPHCGTLLETGPVANAGSLPPLESAGTVVAGPDDDPDAPPNPAADTVRLDFWVPSQAPDPAAMTEVFPAAPPPSSSDTPVPDFLLAASAGGMQAPAAETGAPSEAAIAGVALSGADPGQSREAPSFEPAGAGQPAAVAALEAPLVAQPHSESGEPAPELAALPGVTALESPSALIPRFHDSPAARVAVSEEPAAARGPSRLVFGLLVSYASAATLACLYLLWLVYFLSTHSRTLDLPDLAPKIDNKKVTKLLYVAPKDEVPPANVLKLGETRQYGSLKVTPLRVTRGPVEFQYYDADKEIAPREPEGPVLKLHLRFENVSRNQEFTPLDSRLVFTKEPDRKSFGLFRANNFLCNASERTNRGRHVMVFDLAPDSQWLLKGQNLDRELKPGESFETFIATSQENLEGLSGDLLWRVHFRKGYNPESFRGVTTLIEVRFRSADVVDEPAVPAKEKKPEGRDA